MSIIRSLLLATAFLLLNSMQGFAAELTIEKDPENVVASRLEGNWTAEANLTKRLTGRERALASKLSFQSDPSVLTKVPEKHAEAFAERSLTIYMAGTMKFADKECPFAVTSIHGNPHLLMWFPRNGDPFGNLESMNLMLTVAEKKQNDLLFTGGDFNNQPFSAYQRAESTNAE